MHNLQKKLKWFYKYIHPNAGAFLIIISVSAICSLSGIFLALLTKHLIDSATKGRLDNIFIYIVLILLLIVVDIGAKAIVSVITSRTSVKISNKIQEELFTRIAGTKWLQLAKYHSGDLLTRITSDTEAVTSLLINALPQMLSQITTLVGAITILIVFEPVLTIPALILGPISILVSRFYSSRLKALYIKVQQAEASCRSYMQECIQNIVVVKSFCSEGKNIKHIMNLQNKKLDLTTQRSLTGAATNSTLLFGSWLGYFLVFVWGAVNLSKGISTFGTFTALIQLVGYVQGPFTGISQTLPRAISALASSDRIIELESLQNDAQDPIITNYPAALQATEPQAGIRLEHVSFSYEAGADILKDISIKIAPGEIIALTGSSGEGKTTFIRLLLALLYPDHGHAYITKGQSNVEISASTRHLVSYVPQGNTLFSGTIAENLRYGQPCANDNELEEALRTSCSWEFVQYLKDGINTLIGENGFGLSEGQAQRLTIARALLYKAPILILDEATSALDINTELKVLQAIGNLRPAKTCIIITHRLNALDICDRVFKLEKGFLVESSETFSKAQAIEAI